MCLRCRSAESRGRGRHVGRNGAQGQVGCMACLIVREQGLREIVQVIAEVGDYAASVEVEIVAHDATTRLSAAELR